jgi:hypothetical protein
MQAEHADNIEINGLSGRLIGCAIVIQIALDVDLLHAPPTPSWPGLTALESQSFRRRYKGSSCTTDTTWLVINFVDLLDLASRACDQTRGPWPMKRGGS